MNYDLLICVSKFISNNYSNIPSDKKVILNTPQQSSNVKNKEYVDEFNVFSISNLINWKGVNVYLDSYRLLRNKKNIEIKYHVFGTGIELNRYKEKYKSNNIHIYGYKSDDYIKDFLINKAHLSIVPSIKEEACPHLPILSFSYAIPCIVTNIGGQSDLINDYYNGLKVEPESAESIAIKIDFLIENKDKYIELSKNSKLSSFKYTFDNYLNKINEVMLLKE